MSHETGRKIPNRRPKPRHPAPVPPRKRATAAVNALGTPRGAAWTILKRLDAERRPLDAVLDAFFETAPPMDRRDRNLIHALVFGVQRHRAALDHVIDHLSRTPLAKLDPDVLNLLRIGLFQILHMDRIPDSAAVNTAVDIAKAFAPPWIAGFVNGLLRSAIRSRGKIPFPDMETDPVRALAKRKSFPPWLIRRWLKRWGTADAASLCDAFNRIPPLTLRVNTLRTTREGLLSALAPEVDTARPTAVSPDGVVIQGLGTTLSDLSAFRSGLFQVQDEAAQLVSRFLGPRPGETVLDACAGLGGKTGHLAGLMENRGQILAVDVDARKLEGLAAECVRLGNAITTPVHSDLDADLPPDWRDRFDRILVDAPCSGLGVLGRNPDARWSAAKENLDGYRKRQLRFLSRLAPLVKPLGILGYTVCSMEPEETDAVAEAFLEKHPHFRVRMDAEHLTAGMRALITPEGCLRTFPHRDGMDGFFSVCFVRKM